jgi:hypothetical protein
MPGFDGTGPVGRGARSGRGFGYCEMPESAVASATPPAYGFGFFRRPRLGLGFRRGWGGRGGRGRRFW